MTVEIPNITDTVNIIFDIDGIVACKSTSKNDSPRFYLKKSAILMAADTPHYIFHGFIELFKALHKREDVRISFFSSGRDIRNVDFVKDLMTTALGEEAYLAVKDRIGVFSRKNCMIFPNDEQRRDHEIYGTPHGNQKKDLSVCLEKGESLENTILIEDNSSYIAPGQAKNVFVVPELEDRDYRHLAAIKKPFDKSGFRGIPMILRAWDDTEIGDYYTGRVEIGKEIYLFRTNEKEYTLLYRKELEYKAHIHKLTEVDHGDIIDLLEQSYFESDNHCQYGETIENDALEDMLYKLVTQLSGKTKKICKKANRVCYIAGVIFSAIETAEKEKVSVSDVLFRWQFKKKVGVEKYESQYSKLAKTEKYYLIGLEKLREENPDFTLNTPQSYLQCTNGEFTSEELDYMKEIKKKEHDDCVIM